MSEKFEIKKGGFTATVRIEHDEDCESPFEGCEGTMYSFDRNHINHKDMTSVALRVDQWPVLLRYYEHGNCMWDIIRFGPETSFAGRVWEAWHPDGVWLPPEDLVKEANSIKRKQGPDAAWKRIRDYADLLMKTYTDWCNGNCYGYTVTVKDRNGKQIGDKDSCWGFIGHESVEEEARSSANLSLDHALKMQYPVAP